MNYAEMHAASLAKRNKRREHANPGKPTWRQQLIAAAKASGISEKPQDAVVRLYEQFCRTRNSGRRLVLETRIKSICDRHKWSYPGVIGEVSNG